MPRSTSARSCARFRRVAGGIFLQRGGTLIEMIDQRYATEADLQDLLGAHPIC